jgi:hypothetical protein
METGDPGARFIPEDVAERQRFIGRWCASCARDAPSNSGKDFASCAPVELCPILGGYLNSGESPREWVYDRAGRARCSSHVPKGQPAPPLNADVHTGDLFAS